MRAFMVQMPSGCRYWTVVDDGLRVEPVADRFLRELRFGRDRAESTTKAYAGGVALFLLWCHRTGRQWRDAAADLGLFVIWLRHTQAGGSNLVLGPGTRPARSEGRINRVLVAVRGFLSFGVVNREVPAHVIEQIYELADTRDLPLEAQGEQSGFRLRLCARHHLREPDSAVDRASDAEIVALFSACRSARDRLIVLLLSRAGLRRGEAAGLRRGDLHLLPDNRSIGCAIEGAHLHVIRRDNVNGAWAKSRYNRDVPLDFLLVRAIDQYVVERHRCIGVSVFGPTVGAPARLRQEATFCW